MSKPAKAMFKSEAELCATFIAQMPKGWTAYAESAGFDILLVRDDLCQIGVEAKLTLNAKVVLQASEYDGYHSQGCGPDFRAVLVPYGTAGAEMKAIARRLGITVIEMKSKEAYQALRRPSGQRYVDSYVTKFSPALPVAGEDSWRESWFDQCTPKRAIVPEYVPDVPAGSSAPLQLSLWKIKAIKICIIIEKRGQVAVSDFVKLQIDRKRFMVMGWIQPAETGRGVYVTGRYPLDLRSVHPVNYAQIEADFEKWAPAVEPAPAVQEALL